MAKGSDCRAHHRAQTPLYFSDGLCVKVIVEQKDPNIDTVYDRRKNILSKRFTSLYDIHRSGTPPKLSAIHLEPRSGQKRKR